MRAAVYRETNAETQAGRHEAFFGRERAQAEYASELVRLVGTWKSTQIFARGRRVTMAWRASLVLECYLQALACNDARAHCHRILRIGEAGDDFRVDLEGVPKLVAIDEDATPRRYLVPCAYLAPTFRPIADLPSRLADQLQAHAVRMNADFCPLLDPEDFRPFDAHSSTNRWRYVMKTLVALLLLSALATPALAEYQGFGSPSWNRGKAAWTAPRYDSGYYPPPRRERTTITREGNRTVIETKRYYGPTKGGRLPIGRAR